VPQQLTVGLVSCSKSKLESEAPAQDLYTSHLFRLSRKVCEERYDQWAILSARFGLIMPDQVIAPYDVTLSEMGHYHLRRWASDAEHTIMATWTETVVFHVFAGKRYMKAVASLRHVDELQGLGIGHRLQRLNTMLRKGP